MKKLLLSVGILLSLNAVAQNVGINATGAAPVTSAALDVDMANKGILIPRVALTTTTAFAPVTGTATTSLLVYNSATAGTFPTNVTPGYYYWNGTAWVRLINSGTAWELLGNAGTVTGTNFLGTLDAVGLEFRTNNSTRQFIYSTGEAIFNPVVAAFGGDILTSRATGAQYAINGYLTGSGAGQSGYFSNASTSNASGSLMAVSSNVGYNSYFQINSTANTFPSTVSISQTLTGIGISSSVNSAGTYTSLTGGAGGIFTHPTLGVFAAAVTSTTGNGICTNVGSSTLSTFTGGSGGTFVHSAQGAFGIATGSGNNTFGGYFANGVSFAYVGYRTGGTNYKINGNGTVATMVDDMEGQKVNMFCPEAPEVLFQDYGTAQLVNGRVHITIDPIFAKNIFVDAAHPMKVFVQLEGDCKGVYVTNKTANGFDVVELQGGTSK
jgi:hypothetical protein